MGHFILPSISLYSFTVAGFSHVIISISHFPFMPRFTHVGHFWGQDFRIFEFSGWVIFAGNFIPHRYPFMPQNAPHVTDGVGCAPF